MRSAASFRGLFFAISAVLAPAAAAPPPRAQTVDPAVVGERIERLSASFESLELGLASQRRQIEALGNEVQKLREEALDHRSQRPWADDLKRLSDDVKRLSEAVSEVDRKRIADNEQVLKVLEDIRKSVAAAAAEPRRTPRTPPADPRPPSTQDRGPAPEKAVPYVVQKGDSLSKIVDDFNRQAKQEGYKPVTVQQVMKFNSVTDAKKVREGMTLQLPLYAK